MSIFFKTDIPISDDKIYLKASSFVTESIKTNICSGFFSVILLSAFFSASHPQLK